MIRKILMLILFVIPITLISGCGSTTYETKELTWWDTDFPAIQKAIDEKNRKHKSTWWDTSEAQRMFNNNGSTSGYSPSSIYSNRINNITANSPCNCKGYSGPGGPCYDGPGGPAYAGPGGPAYDGPGGPCYDGPGGPAYDGPGGPCYAGPGGTGRNCPSICK